MRHSEASAEERHNSREGTDLTDHISEISHENHEEDLADWIALHRGEMLQNERSKQSHE